MIVAIESGHVVEELLDFPVIGDLSAHQILLIVASALMIGVFCWAAKALPKAPKKTGFLAFLEYGLVWVRDEICYAFLGPHEGRKYLPLIWTLFFFILVSNLLGLAPFPVYMHGKTDAFTVATGNIAVTSALALIVFVVTQAAGFIKHGPIKYFGTLVPAGVPTVIAPLIFLMELIGLFTKPFALLIRLFANMIAGHALFAILFAMLIPTIGALSIANIGLSAIGVVGILGVFLLETLIALLQAYIFTALAATFISTAVSEGH